ncbi:unnamed protein product [Phytomonas sp. EM1]|nr:unnamed protein product [Phytomonas sp. EM1]|eukprot:CCW62266.1 unnamed protein product [Phytomonas sp. isolate EM1]
MSSVNSNSTPSHSTVDPLSELHARLRSLEDENEYYNQLKARAQNALESHRSDLTLLQQKERAIFAAREDDLRLQLQEALQFNRKAFEKIEEAQRKAHQELREEILATRTEGSTRLNSLQEELEALWRERLKLERDLMNLEGEANRIKDIVRDDIYEQSCLHAELQEAKQALLDSLHQLAATDRSRGTCSKGALETPTVLKTPALLSPRCVESPKKRFIPSGPTIPRARSGPPSRHGSRRCRCACSLSSPLRAARDRRDGSGNIPESHNLASMVSTLERRNYLRPRAYLQRHGRDMGYQSASIKIIGCAPLPLLSASPATVVTPSLRSPPRVSAGEANTRAPRMSTTEGSPSENKSATIDANSPSTSSSVSNNRGNFSIPQQQTQRESHSPKTRPHSKSCAKCFDSSPSGPRSPAPITDGLTLDAACQMLKEEIAELEGAYAAFYEQLHDPCCDSVAASQQMRQLMAVIDRKVDQLQTLRFQQQKHQEKLRIQHVLKQVERENNWCEQVYSNIVHLVRTP